MTQQVDTAAVLPTCKEVVRIAERILQPPPPSINSMSQPADPFDGFDVLCRSLTASIRIAYGVVLTQAGDASPETVLAVIESGLAAEQPRPSAPTLYNLAVAYVNAGRFEEAAACVVRCIDLVSHYTTMHLNLTKETEPPYRCFIQENATYAVLAHHLVASIGSWCNLPHLTLQHAILALRCAERCLGTQHALTTRCAQFVRSQEMQRTSLSPGQLHNLSSSMMNMSMMMDSSVRRSTQDLFASSMRQRQQNQQMQSFGGPPKVPFQMQSFASEFLPSLLVPFTLVQPHPIAFDIPASSLSSRVVPPLLLTRDGSGSIDAGTARRMTNEALRKAKQQQQQQQGNKGGQPLVVIPKPPSSSGRHVVPASGKRGGGGGGGGGGRRHLQHHRQQKEEEEEESNEKPAVMPVHAASPKYLSVIPLRDFDLYRQIQQEVGTLVATTENFVASEMNKRRQNAVSLLRLPAVGTNVVTDKYGASVRALREISYLRPDHTPEDEELWNIAAFKLQKFMRRFVAQLHVERRQASVGQLIRRHLAADTIHESWQLYKLRRAAKRRLHFLQQKKSELDCLIMVQSSLRFHTAMEHYAAGFLRHLEFKLWERQHWKQMQLGATLVQAVWRSHASRGRTRFTIQQAVRIQRFRRVIILFRLMRLCVFARRQRRRAFYHRLHSSAARMQRWFRHEMPRVHALRELRRRQALRDAELDGRLGAEWAKYLPFRNADHDECGRRIVRFLRGVIWRRNDAERYRRAMLRHAAATIVRRAFLRFKCRRLRRLHREETEERLRILRRKEEVREAVYDLQRFGRGFLGRARIYEYLRQQAIEEAAAQRIQRFTLILHARVLRREVAKRRAFEAARYEAAALRLFSAVQIQCAWRRFEARRFVRGFATFLNEGRNVYVSKIQRAWRRHRARGKYHRMAVARVERYEAEKAEQQQLFAVKRIQRAFRSALQLRMGKKFAVATVFELAKLRRAATMIQRRWRYALARLVRFDLARRRDEQVSRLRAEEHRVAAAIRLQRWGHILIAKHEGSATSRAAALPAYRERCARRIQCMTRCFRARKQVRALQLSRDALIYEETYVKERFNAAVLLQRNARMWNAQRRYEAEKAAARVIKTMWHAIFVRRHLRTARIMDDYSRFLAEEDKIQEL